MVDSDGVATAPTVSLAAETPMWPKVLAKRKVTWKKEGLNMMKLAKAE
jgi:hypothetical protein